MNNLIHFVIQPFFTEYQFPLPKLVYSDYEDGCGVLVMEDWAPKKYKLDQPDLMRLLDPGTSKFHINQACKYFSFTEKLSCQSFKHLTT